MGNRNYYCDFCDRSFLDSPHARKMHLMSTRHVKLRKEHYHAFRDPEVVLAEESAKLPCKRFQKTGECMFGITCKFSHFTQDQLWSLQEEVNARNALKGRNNFMSQSDVPSLSTWLEKRNKVKVNVKEKSTILSEVKSWHLPHELQGRPDLPPSLQGIHIEKFVTSEFYSWG